MKSNIAPAYWGLPQYAAPEVVRGLQYDGCKADMWGCRAILFAWFTGKLPLDDISIRILL
jgi:BR serine/threonine kinase